MNQTYKDREVRCYFGILNLRGLMDTDNHLVDNVEDYGEVRNPLFAHQTYKIKTTFNRNLFYTDTFEQEKDQFDVLQTVPRQTSHFGALHFTDESNPMQKKYYQKKFRRNVLWDFGDGTKIEGYSAEHAYKKPGRYKITCTFFDINRQAWVNNYCIYVVVKEVLPTVLRFDKTYTNPKIKCSKVERIARMEALLSNTIAEPLTVSAKRIFSQQEHEEEYIEISKKFDQIPDNIFRFMDRSWCFLENTQVLYYNSDDVYMNYIEPSDIFHPNYQDLYGKFYYNELDNTIDFSFYQVIPFKNIDENLKTITILDPNASILSEEGETYKTYSITQLYLKEFLPDDVVYVGKRGWFDIFYKCDFVSKGHLNTFSIFYDIEDKNITNQLETSTNYLNINPMGFSVQVVGNNVNDVMLGLSLDGFIREVEDGDDWANPPSNNTYIDPHLMNTLIKGADLDVFLFPYIPYDSESYIIEDTEIENDIEKSNFVPYNKAYYVPKDIILDCHTNRMIHSKYGNSSIVNSGVIIDDDGNIVALDGDNGFIEAVYSWFWRIPIILRDYIDLNIITQVIGQNGTLQWSPRLTKMPLLDTNDVEIPLEKQYSEDIDRLLNVYMAHPMFDEAWQVRNMFKAFLGGNFLNYVMTRSQNFLDDTVNVRTCYLSNLISILKMMGEDVTEFEKSAFEGVNDLKNFVRILSINHGDLVGHVIDEQYDITIKSDYKGKNVGDEIDVDDLLYINDTKDVYTGKITAIKRKNTNKTLNVNVNSNEQLSKGVDLIVHDRYTNESKVVSLMQMQVKLGENTVPSITLGEYDESWGWNLLLPTGFQSAKKKIEDLQAKCKNPAYSTKQIEYFENEINRYKAVRKDLVNGYYSFHLLNPTTNKVRVGNFMDGKFINDRIYNVKSWEEVWGITHEVLLKIIFENAKLFNERTFTLVDEWEDEQEDSIEYITTADVNIVKNFEEAEVLYDLFINGKQSNRMKISGTVQISGKINGQGKNQLLVKCDNGLVDKLIPFRTYLTPRYFEIQVNYDGSINEHIETYYIDAQKVQGSIKVTMSGNVVYPLVNVKAEIHVVDDRVNGSLAFDNTNIHTHQISKFYCNIKRQELEDSDIEGGIVDYSGDNGSGRLFNVLFKLNGEPVIGENVGVLNASYDMGFLYYRHKDTQSELLSDLGTDVTAPYYGSQIIDHEVKVIINDIGEISFAEPCVLDISNLGTKDNPQIATDQWQKGSLYFVLSGNVLSNDYRLDCYNYNPQNESESVMRMLVDVGGYYYGSDVLRERGTFLVNGEDGWQQGYKLVVSSRGTEVFAPFDNLMFPYTQTVYVLDAEDNVVYKTEGKERKCRASVDEYGYIQQDSYRSYYNEDVITGWVAISTHSGYYSLDGYMISVNK